MSNKRIYSAEAPPAFTRWTPALIDEMPAAEAAAEQPAAEPLLDYLEARAETEEPAAVNDPVPAGPDPAELEALLTEARQQGFDEGLEQGRQQSSRERDQLRQLLHELTAHHQQVQQHLATAVLQLAMDLTRHLLRSELYLKPEHIVSLVQDMMQALPQPAGHPRLHLQPDDAALVHQQLGSELDVLGWKLVPDASLQRGDCLIETHHGELNATLATRWAQLCDSLGQKLPLAPDDEPA